MRTPDTNGRAIPFDISYRTFNSNSKTGGKMKYYENAKLVMKEKSEKDEIRALKFKPSEEKEINKKNPQHFKNKTRNIRLEDGGITKINVKFIHTFNGIKVIY